MIAVAFSPDGALLASTARGYVIHLWTADGEPVAALEQDIGPWSLAFSPDGRLIATGTWEPSIVVWDVVTRRQVARLPDKSAKTGPRDSHGRAVWSVAWHPHDPRLLVSGADDGMIRIWDLEEQRCLAILDAFAPASVLTVGFGPDGGTLLGAGGDGDVVIFDLDELDRRIAGNLEIQLGRALQLGEELDVEFLRTP